MPSISYASDKGAEIERGWGAGCSGLRNKLRSPKIIPRYRFLDLPCDVTDSVARFRLCAHTLRIKTVTWIHNTSPTCDLCNANEVQDE